MGQPQRAAVAWMVMLMAVASVAARQTARPQPSTLPRERAVPFSAGEVLSYEVSWANLLTAATATVTVVDKRATYASLAHYITAEGRPTGLVSALYPVSYKADTLVDVFTLLPQRSSIYSDEKGRRRYNVTKFDQKARTFHYEQQAGDPAKIVSQRDEATPAQAHDALSAIFALRATPLAPGTTLPMSIVVNGHVYRVEMSVRGPERVRCGLGEIDAWRVTPTLLDARERADGRDMAIWISNDARRLPVKLQGALPVGTFSLVLSGTSAR